MATMTVNTIEKKVACGEPLSVSDGLWLYENLDLYALGELGQERRLLYHGRKTYYIRNRHIDYSNACVLSCKFCAFARKRGEAWLFEHSSDEIVEKATAGLRQGITELHIVGGFHPDLPFEFYTGMLQALKRLSPSLHLKCFTAAEIDYFSRRFKLPIAEVFEKLIAAGLDSM